MHYRRKNTAKISTGSFYLSEDLIQGLEKIADFYDQSRNRVLECALRFYFGENYEKAKYKAFKKTQKIPFKKNAFKKSHKTQQILENEPKLPFDFSN